MLGAGAGARELELDVEVGWAFGCCEDGFAEVVEDGFAAGVEDGFAEGVEDGFAAVVEDDFAAVLEAAAFGALAADFALLVEAGLLWRGCEGVEGRGALGALLLVGRTDMSTP